MSVTKAQKHILDSIERFMKVTGYCPSYDEIAKTAGLKSIATVHVHLKHLEKKGIVVINGFRDIHIIPSHVREYKSCKDGHDLIFFKEGECPACRWHEAYQHLLRLKNSQSSHPVAGKGEDRI